MAANVFFLGLGFIAIIIAILIINSIKYRKIKKGNEIKGANFYFWLNIVAIIITFLSSIILFISAVSKSSNDVSKYNIVLLILLVVVMIVIIINSIFFGKMKNEENDGSFYFWLNISAIIFTAFFFFSSTVILLLSSPNFNSGKIKSTKEIAVLLTLFIILIVSTIFFISNSVSFGKMENEGLYTGLNIIATIFTLLSLFFVYLMGSQQITKPSIFVDVGLPINLICLAIFFILNAIKYGKLKKEDFEKTGLYFGLNIVGIIIIFLSLFLFLFFTDRGTNVIGGKKEEKKEDKSKTEESLSIKDKEIASIKSELEKCRKEKKECIGPLLTEKSGPVSVVEMRKLLNGLADNKPEELTKECNPFFSKTSDKQRITVKK